MDLTGHWEGIYIYGSAYPRDYRGLLEPFEFHILDKDGAFSGTCTDKIVTSIAGDESYILGSFKQKEILFKKRYKFHLPIDENGTFIENLNIQSDGVDYKGRLRKRFLSRKPYFSGEWSITTQYKDKSNLLKTHVSRGTWRMWPVK